MAKERRSLSGKVVAITGGARGIGRSTAEALVRKGCRVALGDLDLDLAERTAAELGGGTIAVRLDVTDRESFAAFLDEAERQLGPLDVLVNNAGIMPVTRFAEESDDSIRRQLDINVYGVVAGTQLALERMRPRRGGHIVNLASSAGKAGVPGIATYSGTKHFVVGFTEAVRAECREEGIDLSYVMPITVNTQLIEGLQDYPGVKRVEPEDVANEIVGALETGKVDVYVPRQLRASVVIGTLLPRRAREAVARFMGVTKVMTEVSPEARRAYEERAAYSEPGEEPASSPADAAPSQRDAA
ncbi:MAG TPA: SDR family oxidoreductase [Solirubrobacterales bacterium]|nr:SDR family oxidoreductase [Solirubrobacterales bacterium]